MSRRQLRTRSPHSKPTIFLCLRPVVDHIMRVCRHNGLSGTRRAEAGIYAALPLARKTWHVVNIQWSPAR